MKVIFTSSLYKTDPQINLLKKTLIENGSDFLMINPLKFTDVEKLELVSKGGKNTIIFNGKEFEPDCFYVARKWRTDCVVTFPEVCITPTLYRSKLNAFLIDIAYSFDSAKWIPGRITSIDLSESKCALYCVALNCGLMVPEKTINSIVRPLNASYRKSLSDPFTITYDLEEKEEIAVTLFNSDPPDDGDGGIPWQWQTKICSQEQIRSVFVEERFWTFSVKQSDLQGLSLREVQDSRSLNWKETSLPTNITERIFRLLNTLGLKMACPEFMINTRGEYVFIDLNPCGDWFGFGSDQINKDIASAIVNML